MRAIIMAAMLLTSLFASAQVPLDSTKRATGPRPGLGLVLSGGGAKGIAHIGFIAALEQEGIKIDCITGTSMGAIVGSLYASGYSPQEMMQLLASKEFREWSSGEIPPRQLLRYAEPELTPQWVAVNFSPNTSLTDALPTRLINPLPMSWAFLKLYSPVTGACKGNFNELMVPLRTVASDIASHSAVVFGSGELADAVRASMSFPLVFQPIEVNGKILYDGGLYDVYPVDVMVRDFNPRHIIGLNVSSPNTAPKLNNLISQINDMIVNDVNYPFPKGEGNFNVRFHLDRFGLLDWGAADTIFNVGYRRAMSMMDSIKRSVPGRISARELAEKRQAFKKRMPHVAFDSICISGASIPKERYMAYLMELPLQGTRTHKVGAPEPSWKLPPASLEQAGLGFYNIASTGRMRNLVPHAAYCDSTGLYSLSLHADVDRDYKFSVGGFLTSSAGSFLYFSGRYDPFALLKPGARFQGWAGQNYLAARAEVFMNLNTRVPSQLGLVLQGSRMRMFERDRMFYDFSTPAFLSEDRLSTGLEYKLMALRHGVFTIHASFAHMVTGFHTAVIQDSYDETRRRWVSNLAVVGGAYTNSTLNDQFAPTTGTEMSLRAAMLSGSRVLKAGKRDEKMLSANGVWGRFEASVRHFVPLDRHFSLGAGASALYLARPLPKTDYQVAILSAPQFNTTATSLFLFDPAMRADQYLTASLKPIWHPSQIIQTSVQGWLYAPMRRIVPDTDGGARYSGWFDKLEGAVRLSVLLRLPIATLQGYVDWRSSPAQHWSAGISFGLPIYAPAADR